MVSRIRIRATTITDWDRKELIIPNKNFITGDLINWTLSDPIMRLRLPVGIAYGSDTALAYKLLLEEAEANSTVLKEPGPNVLFFAFGESSLDFELRVYIRGISNYLKTKHELNMRIDQAFRKNGIEIAFPQRDLHIRSVDRPLPIMQKPYEKPDEEEKET
jgi:potassium efflux system protein